MYVSSESRSAVSLRSILATGLLVAITTSGALFGLGMRAGEALRVFRLVGRNILGLGEVNSDVQLIVTGLGHHLVVATLWGSLLAAVVLRLQGFSRLLVCVFLVPLYLVAIPRVVPPLLRVGHAVTSSAADMFPIAAAISVALLGGAWVAKRD
jgi:hypothetical protein